MLDDRVLEQCRVSWLKGRTLRNMASELGVTHTLLYSRLKAKYGANVCNRKAHSLQRSLLKDYKGKEELEASILLLPPNADNVQYFSKKADNTWSHNKQLENVEIALNNIAATEYEYNEPLRLGLFILLCTVIAYTLKVVIKVNNEEYI